MTIPATNPPAPEFKPHGPIMWVPDWNKAQAAISLKVPMSGIPELDDMIRESRRLDMATEMLAHRTQHADYALTVADALLAESGEEKP